MTPKGPWSREEIERFLEDTRIPVRIAANSRSGFPLLASLWYLPEDGALWCATPRSSQVASLLARDPRCAFEVSVEAPPYVGVRGQALATLHPERGEEVLRALLARYVGDSAQGLSAMLLARAAGETAIALEPENLLSWDFRERMGEAA